MYYESNYLSHHGVLGMKWGVRRYQNKDGTLTAEGKKRQSDTNKKVLDPEKKHTVTSETALNHITDYLDNKITEDDSKKLEELWNNGNETFMKWYDNKDDSLKEQYKKDRDAAFEAYEKKSLEVLSKVIKENGNKELSDAIDKHYDSENPYDLYKSLLNENESLAKSFDAYSTIFDMMVDSYMANKRSLSHSVDDHLEHRYHKYIKKYWVNGKWRYVYADKGDHQKLESYASDYKNYSKIASSTTDSYRRRTEWETKARESENKFIHLMNKRSIKTITKKEIEVGRSYLTNLLKKIGNRII